MGLKLGVFPGNLRGNLFRGHLVVTYGGIDIEYNKMSMEGVIVPPDFFVAKPAK